MKTRTMTRLMPVCLLFAFALAAAGSLPAEDVATSPEAGPTRVTRQEVWQAMTDELRRQGFRDAQLPRIDDLDLPVALPAVPGRKLRVLSACWDQAAERMQFRLECGEPGQCLPFLAYARVRDVRDNAVHLDGDGRDSGMRNGACRSASVSHATPGVVKPLTNLTVRPGERATTVFVSGWLRIAASVTCLDRGVEGDVIRVRSEDGQVFRARVAGPALLEAVQQ
jgi:hypothetical protein